MEGKQSVTGLRRAGARTRAGGDRQGPQPLPEEHSTHAEPGPEALAMPGVLADKIQKRTQHMAQVNVCM